MSEADSVSSRKRRSKWDVPGDVHQQPQDKMRKDQPISGPSDTAQKARERAAQIAAKLAADRNLAPGIAPPPIVAPYAGFRPPLAQSVGSLTPNKFLFLPDPEIINLDNGGYMADFEINDIPARASLTKKAVQDKICQQSGAAIATKGRFMSPIEKQQLKSSEKPLYLCVQAPIQAKVQVALHMIKDVIRNFGKPESNANSFNGTQNSSQSYIQGKVFVGLEQAPPEYNAREKLEGPSGSFFHHIIAQTGAKVHLRGKGSGFVEASSGRESFEPLHIYISHPSHNGLQSAKALCENLLHSVHGDFKNWDRSSGQPGPQSLQGYSQPVSSSYGQQPIAYPGYNAHVPSYNQSHLQAVTSRPNMQGPPPVYSQPPPVGQYPPTNYPPTQYPRQPLASSYALPYTAGSVTAYPPYYHQPRHDYPPPISQDSAEQRPPFQSLPQGLPPPSADEAPPGSSSYPHLQASTPGSVSSGSGSQPTVEPSQDASGRPKRRRFTEAPDLIRKSTKAEDTKESPSHSLASNTKFRSTGEDISATSRDSPPEATSSLFNKSSRDFTAPSNDPSIFSTRRKSDTGFKPPVLPVSAVIRKTKTPVPKKQGAKNVLSSLIPYGGDSDSEEEV